MKTIYIIAGPTASGKTQLAIQTALHFGTEIISADSRQCFRELAIGVAKPNEQELATVKHHFINSHSIHEEMSAGAYVRFTLPILTHLFEQYQDVVLCGGTGLYIKALIEGIDPIPPVPNETEKEVETNFGLHGIEWLQKELATKDPLTYSRIDTQNPMRLLRALSFWEAYKISITTYQTGKTQKIADRIIMCCIDLPRPILYDRINARVDKMMQEGLLEEVRTLLPFRDYKSLQTVGYQEFFSFFDGQCSLEEAINKVKQHTRNYAKRQQTWFKNQHTCHWLPFSDPFTALLELSTNYQE